MLQRQEPACLAVLGCLWVPHVGELLQGAEWDGELGLKITCIKLHFNLGLIKLQQRKCEAIW